MSIDMITASARLSNFISERAAAMIRVHGITFFAVPDAPETYPDLLYAYQTARRRGTYLPVSSLHCDSSIYTKPEINHACRYWHDMLHCLNGRDFSLSSELDVGRQQADAVARFFGKGSTEHLLMLADTVGQSIYDSIHGKFPDNQREFCLKWVAAHQ